MMQVSLDTSFLISFSDPDRPNHAVAVEYFRYCLAQRVPMHISTVAAGEFAVKQQITDLPLQNFRILPYNLLHATKAASLYNAYRKENPASSDDKRPIIINDLKLIAQAAEDNIAAILTEDVNTLSKMVKFLRERSIVSVQAIPLSDGFTQIGSDHPAQGRLPFPPPAR